MSRLGLHVHFHGLPAEAETGLHEFISRAKSNVLLVLNDAKKTHKLQARYPNRLIVLRLMPRWGGTDDSMFRKGHTAEEHAQWYAENVSDKRIICVDGNEPQPPYADGVVQWSIDFANACLKRGLRAGLLNSSVGTLPAEQVPKLHPLLELIADHPDQLFLCLHEYTPPNFNDWFPWLMGNFIPINSYCDSAGIHRPPLLFVEWGYDTRKDYPYPQGSWCIRDVVNKVGQVEAARILIAAYQGIYQSVENVVGLCIYSWGAETDDWQRFNIVTYPEFVETLLTEWPDDDPPPPPEPPTVIIDPMPEPPIPQQPKSGNWKGKYILGGLTARLNIRQKPAGEVIGSLGNGDVVDLTGIWINAVLGGLNGTDYVWYETTSGWFAQIGVTLTPYPDLERIRQELLYLRDAILDKINKMLDIVENS